MSHLRDKGTSDLREVSAFVLVLGRYLLVNPSEAKNGIESGDKIVEFHNVIPLACCCENKTVCICQNYNQLYTLVYCPCTGENALVWH